MITLKKKGPGRPFKPERNHKSTSQLHEKHYQRQVGVQEKLYSGSFVRFITQFLSILLRSLYVKPSVTYKTYKKTAIIEFWKHTHLPI